MQFESCKDIECRVARIATDKGRKTGCLLKLYRNGVELPTARQIWIDFVIINDENTHYQVDYCQIIHDKAFDVVITDNKGVVFYDGIRRRNHQEYYALKHNLPMPADTIEIEQYHEELRREAEDMRQKRGEEERLNPKPQQIITAAGRKMAKEFVKNHPGWYPEQNADEMSDQELVEVLREKRNIMS